MRVAIGDIDGVDSVRVSLEAGLATIHLRASNRVSVAQVRNAVRNNGFTPKEAEVELRGHVTLVNGAAAIEVEGSGDVLLLADASGVEGKTAELSRLPAGTAVTVIGQVPQSADKGLRGLLRLLVRSFAR